MNKVILMGRLTRDPETRYSQSAEPVAITKYSLAVNRQFKRENEPDADFINCVAFGKRGEFAEKYFKKGQMVSVVGRMQVSSWEDQSGQKRWSTDVIIDEQFFAESKSSFENRESRTPSFDGPPPPSADSGGSGKPAVKPEPDGFYAIDESLDDEDLPF